jgi:hypothetical protein
MIISRLLRTNQIRVLNEDGYVSQYFQLAHVEQG